ncbi:MAG: hypothetical protein V4608_03225 [Bacteroidota bacterium]
MQELKVKNGTIRLSPQMAKNVTKNFPDLSNATVMDVLEYLSTAKK